MIKTTGLPNVSKLEIENSNAEVNQFYIGSSKKLVKKSRKLSKYQKLSKSKKIRQKVGIHPIWH